MKWIMLLIAGMTEVTWAVAMKAAEGFTKTVPSVITVVGYVLSAVLLAKATQTLPLGTAYPVWTGIGAVGAVIVGIFIFKEPATFWRLFFLTTLIGSIIGLKSLS